MKATVIAGTLFIAIAGCASQSQQTPPAQAKMSGSHHGAHGMHMGGQMMAMCPMQVEGAKVSMSNIDDGIKMSFTASSKNVETLRERVKQTADMHNQRHAKGTMGSMGHGQQGVMVASTATPIDTVDGADLVLVPQDAADLEKLRAHGRMMGDKMQSGTCPMMQKQAAAETTTPDGDDDAVDHESHH